MEQASQTAGRTEHSGDSKKLLRWRVWAGSGAWVVTTSVLRWSAMVLQGLDRCMALAFSPRADGGQRCAATASSREESLPHPFPSVLSTEVRVWQK